MKRLCPRCANLVRKIGDFLMCSGKDCPGEWESDGDLESERLARYEHAMKVVHPDQPGNGGGHD